MKNLIIIFVCVLSFARLVFGSGEMSLCFDGMTLKSTAAKIQVEISNANSEEVTLPVALCRDV